MNSDRPQVLPIWDGWSRRSHIWTGPLLDLVETDDLVGSQRLINGASEVFWQLRLTA